MLYVSYIQTILLLLTNGEFKMYHPLLVRVLCFLFPFQLRVCEALVGLVSGTNFAQSDPVSEMLLLVPLKANVYFVRKLYQYNYYKTLTIRLLER